MRHEAMLEIAGLMLVEIVLPMPAKSSLTIATLLRAAIERSTTNEQ
jgi:hypothetical protein